MQLGHSLGDSFSLRTAADERAVINISHDKSGRYLYEGTWTAYASSHVKASSFINKYNQSVLIHFLTVRLDLLTNIGLAVSSDRIGPAHLSGSPQQCMRLDWLLSYTPVVSSGIR